MAPARTSPPLGTGPAGRQVVSPMNVARMSGPGRWSSEGRELSAGELATDVCAALKAGMGAVLPADTTYALCFSPDVPGWLDRLCEAKSRPRDLPVSLFFSSPEQMARYGEIGPDEMDLLGRLLPGPSTVIVRPGPAALGLPGGWPFDGLGMRLVDVPILTRTCGIAGPVTATSVNRHGSPGALTVDDALRELGGKTAVEWLVDGGLLPGGHSQVVDIRGGRERVIRAGELHGEGNR